MAVGQKAQTGLAFRWQQRERPGSQHHPPAMDSGSPNASRKGSLEEPVALAARLEINKEAKRIVTAEGVKVERGPRRPKLSTVPKVPDSTGSEVLDTIS